LHLRQFGQFLVATGAPGVPVAATLSAARPARVCAPAAPASSMSFASVPVEFVVRLGDDPAAARASNARGPAPCRRRTPAMGRRPAPPRWRPGVGRGPSRPITRTRWPLGGTVHRHGGLPDRRGEVDGPEAGRERVEELGAGDELSRPHGEQVIEAEVEGSSRSLSSSWTPDQSTMKIEGGARRGNA